MWQLGFSQIKKDPMLVTSFGHPWSSKVSLKINNVDEVGSITYIVLRR